MELTICVHPDSLYILVASQDENGRMRCVVLGDVSDTADWARWFLEENR